MVGSVSENILTTMGTKIANVPQLVPEAKARMQATTKMTAGSILYSHAEAAYIRS